MENPLHTWGLFQASVRLRNRGADPVPFDRGLLSRAYGGARLFVEVTALQSGTMQVFLSDPLTTPYCGKETIRTLASGDEELLLVTVGGKLTNDPRAGGAVFTPAFPVQYSCGGQEYVSNEIGVFATEPSEWTAHAAIAPETGPAGPLAL